MCKSGQYTAGASSSESIIKLLELTHPNQIFKYFAAIPEEVPLT